MRFSERIGKSQPKNEIQKDSIDMDLRVGLWNIFDLLIGEPLTKTTFLSQSPLKTFFWEIWFSHFKEPTDSMPAQTGSMISNIRTRFFKWEYLDVYDFFEFIIQQELPSHIINKDELIESLNFILERELSGYRIIDECLVPITSEEEIVEIEKAILQSDTSKFKGINIHLKSALEKLSDKKTPDYRNSIKESISAVESIAKIISGDSKADLGKALKSIKTKISIHSALEQGFLKIYGFTSDSNGIRHALLDEPDLHQEDAIYMLVSCSSFINYLMVKANKAKIF